jgi:hypothetical protein
MTEALRPNSFAWWLLPIFEQPPETTRADNKLFEKPFALGLRKPMATEFLRVWFCFGA